MATESDAASRAPDFEPRFCYSDCALEIKSVPRSRPDWDAPGAVAGAALLLSRAVAIPLRPLAVAVAPADQCRKQGNVGSRNGAPDAPEPAGWSPQAHGYHGRRAGGYGVSAGAPGGRMKVVTHGTHR